tara:strand:- start:4136 stop:4450 length:315 start_codon:yes stop_codon:yes gene_type:complete
MRKRLELKWHGKEYKLLVTMEVIDRVEDQVSAGVLLSRQLSGDIRFSHVAKFISILLNEAGAETTQEGVYTDMFSDGATSIVEANELLSYLLASFFPPSKKKDT